MKTIHLYRCVCYPCQAAWLILVCLTLQSPANAEEKHRLPYPISIEPNEPEHSDSHHPQVPLPHPDWFKDSKLDMPRELANANQHNKGLVLYFGRNECPFCEALLEKTLSQPDIIYLMQTRFNTIALDIWGSRTVTTLESIYMTEQVFAEYKSATSTPTLLFYDRQGKQVLHLRGYYPPYTFRAALDYVISSAYNTSSLSTYLGQVTQNAPIPQAVQKLFMPPPYNLNRSRSASQRLLLVVFEQPACHRCDWLYQHWMNTKDIQDMLSELDLVKLDAQAAELPVVTPDGKHTTAHEWAKQLSIRQFPELLFFDAQGAEIFRIDDITEFQQLAQILRHLLNI